MVIDNMCTTFWTNGKYNERQIMVVLSANIEDVAPVPCELKLESGRFIRYVATKDANPRKEIVGRGVFESIGLPDPRLSEKEK
ncbi:hypothetical protein GCK32_008378 [Trichostrongylus colubriformis]|uniref:Uncharacterized protein n=1 Tax=Trichostrongylus colubriformis TaxID=6319 RepID=A0AAN8IKU3_TRICO